MWRRIVTSQGSPATFNNRNHEEVALASFLEDPAIDDRGTSTLQEPRRNQQRLDLEQQERLRQIEEWRRQDERLYPCGLERKRSSTDDNLQTMFTTPVIHKFMMMSMMMIVVEVTGQIRAL